MTLRARGILAGLLLVLFMGNAWMTHDVLTAPYPGHNDFVSRYIPLRAFWLEGIDPYSDEATARIHAVIYGRPALPNEDPGLFAYPFYILFPLLPLAWLDYPWASAVFMVLLEFLLLAALVMSLGLFRWRPRPLLLATLFLFTLLSYFPMRGLILGQPGLLVYFLEVAALVALARKQDSWAAVALALSTIKPQMGYLFVPALLLLGLGLRRWRFLAAFGLAFGGLMLASFLLAPRWLNDWLAQVALYPSYTALGSPVWILAHYPWLGQDAAGQWGVRGGFGHLTEAALNLALYVALAWAWWTVIVRRRYERALWAVVLTLVITHLVAPRTATPHFVVFLLPLVFWLREWTTRQRGATLGATLLLLALALAQWAHFLLTVEGEFEHPSVYLPTPFLVLGLLLATRQRWWDDPHAPFREYAGVPRAAEQAA